ncbi:MAG: hypothetical protein J0L82_05870 [Deltaproteobacteria bacterium]|nr:hypothetical protein [Deltaproteobacteria bacterium]
MKPIATYFLAKALFAFSLIAFSSVADAKDSETCPTLYETLKVVAGRALRLSSQSPSSNSLSADLPLQGRFQLTPVSGHDDIFEGATKSGQKFIFRTDEARAKLEVSVYRFARAAGFNVPTTTYAEINGIRGSAQEMVQGQKSAADYTRENDWQELSWHRPDPVTRVFDSILAMNDRNPSNYFITSDRQQILFDHEQAFYVRRDNFVLRDGINEVLDEKTVRRFIQADPERARRLADVTSEADFLWALRDLTDAQKTTFRQRIKLYRRLYRRALETL